MERAKELLHEHRIEKLLVVDDARQPARPDHDQGHREDRALPERRKDALGRLRCGAAVGVGAGPPRARARRCVDAGVDVIVVDTAHGHSRGVLETMRRAAAHFPELPLIGGNVATAEGAEALIKAGVSAVKVGVGPGSICTTRVVAGVGVPQFTAVIGRAPQVARALRHPDDRRRRHQVLRRHREGARRRARRRVMIGSLFAGTDEAPGEVVLYQGRSYKVYRGMGSLGAMADGSRDRYFQADVEEPSKLVPEGIEGRVPVPRQPLAAASTSWSAGCARAWATVGAAEPRRAAREGALRADLVGRAPREPRARRDHHEGSSELPDRVDRERRAFGAGSPGRVPRCPHRRDRILILDFGSQYTQLIARRIRERHVYCEIHPCRMRRSSAMRAFAPGGHRALGRPVERARRRTRRSSIRGVLELGVPVLGICYGLQLLAQQLGGVVETAERPRVRPRAR